MFDLKDIQDLRFFDQFSGTRLQPQKVYHPGLGDLSAHDAFIMPGGTEAKYTYTEITPLYIHLSVTGRCQASCQGCINIAFNDTEADTGVRKNVPFNDTDPVRDAHGIANLIKKNPYETATICLYGGEPLLACDKIKAL